MNNGFNGPTYQSGGQVQNNGWGQQPQQPQQNVNNGWGQQSQASNQQANSAPQWGQAPHNGGMQPNMNNWSGNSYKAELPTTTGEPAKFGWSWGAFMFNVLWATGNKVKEGWVWAIVYGAYIVSALLSGIPLLGGILVFLSFVAICVLPFVFGAKGKSWAYQNSVKNGWFKSTEEFNAAMRSWDRAGKIWFIAYVITLVVSLVAVIILGIIGFSFASELGELAPEFEF